jgi:hypothetical protein
MTLKQLGISTWAPTMHCDYRARRSHVRGYSLIVSDMAQEITPGVTVQGMLHTDRIDVEVEEASDVGISYDFPEGDKPQT